MCLFPYLTADGKGLRPRRKDPGGLIDEGIKMLFFLLRKMMLFFVLLTLIHPASSLSFDFKWNAGLGYVIKDGNYKSTDSFPPSWINEETKCSIKPIQNLDSCPNEKCEMMCFSGQDSLGKCLEVINIQIITLYFYNQ